MVASLSMQLETTPDIVGCPVVVLVTGLSSIHATSLLQFKPPPDAGPGQPLLIVAEDLCSMSGTKPITLQALLVNLHPLLRINNVKDKSSSLVLWLTLVLSYQCN